MNRRELLKWMAITSGAAAAPSWVWATSGTLPYGRRLVTIFLRGAADGLTVCAPLGSPQYFDARPTLALSETDALDLDGFFGLHPAAAGLKALFDSGDLAIFHASGLATAQRSHFQAQSAMEQGIDSVDLPPGTGWISRYLDGLSLSSPLAAVSLHTAVPQSMAGTPSALAVSSIDQFSLQLDDNAQSALASAYARDPLLDPTASAALTAADALEPVAGLPLGEGYPAGPLGAGLADTARLIRSDSGLVCAALNSGGWDHHDDQANQIEPLLAQLGDALTAFRDDIGNQWANTTVVIQTEFGRRVRENAAGGTDHGHGGVMIAAGGGVNGGQVYADWPGLASGDLSAGEDLAVTTDYRQVLAEMLAVQFGVSETGDIFSDFTPGPWRGIFSPAAASQAATVNATRTVQPPPRANTINDPKTPPGRLELDLPALPAGAAAMRPG